MKKILLQDVSHLYQRVIAAQVQAKIAAFACIPQSMLYLYQGSPGFETIV